jgi:hypothetical protein
MAVVVVSVDPGPEVLIYLGNFVPAPLHTCVCAATIFKYSQGTDLFILRSLNLPHHTQKCLLN